jgi:hypothetical protein
VIYLHDPFPSFAGTLPNKNPSIQNGQGVTYTAADSGRMPYVQNWTFGFQYQLPASTVIEVNYVGNKGTRLLSYGFDQINQVPLSELARGNVLGDQWSAASGVPLPYAGFTGTVAQALRPYPQYTGIGQQFPTLGTSTYNALQIQATRHLKSGLSYLVAYTFSKAINTAGDNALDGESVADVRSRHLEKAISSFNFPQFLKVTWIYELPFGPNKPLKIDGVVGKIVGGWSMTGNHFVRSGSPISIGVATAANPITTARPDLILGVPIVTNPDASVSFRGFAGGETYLNRAAFADPPVHPGGRNYIQRLGTMGPRLPNIRGPFTHGHDLAVVKAHKFGENVNWEIRGVFTNFMNHPLRNNPETSLASPFFGQILGKGGQRNMELSTRITF